VHAVKTTKPDAAMIVMASDGSEQIAIQKAANSLNTSCARATRRRTTNRFILPRCGSKAK
jgi:hypothetical protein